MDIVSRSRVLRLPLAKVLQSFFWMRSSWPVWFSILNRRSRHLFTNARINLSLHEKKIVDTLAKEGIAVTHLDELFPGENMLSLLQAYAEDLTKSAEVKTQKSFLKYYWDPYPLLDLQNPYLALVLSPRILAIVNSYFRMYTKFYYFTLNLTLPVSEGAEAVQSQRWHRDPEDKKMCKIFIYLNDVDEGAGPFMYIRGSQYGGKWSNIYPQRPPKGSYPPAGAIERIILQDDINVSTGRAGTVIFCDTGGLHKGGYATRRERLMFTGGFYSPASVRALRFKYSASLKNDLAKLSDEARFALTPPEKKFSSLLFYKFKKYFSGDYE